MMRYGADKLKKLNVDFKLNLTLNVNYDRSTKQ